ncbi:MAG: phenylacetate--CoA ligase family protein [Phycisphaerae bacterium]
MLTPMARTFYRVQERLLGRKSFRILQQLRGSESWPRERLEEIQLLRLQELVSAAYRHTPYWREVMDSRKLQPDDIRSLEDLKKFPLLEKPTLRKRREEMVWREEGPRLQLVRTSGSTNEALQFYTNANREAQINAARMRGHEWIGIRKGDREMYFWASPVELSKQDRIKHFRDWLINDGLTNALEMTDDQVDLTVEAWRNWGVKCLFGYPSSLVLLSHMAERQGVDLSVLSRDGSLKAICTTSEMLTDEDREIISQAFDTPVYDSYGLREGGLIGHECEHFTMHTCDEQVFLETIDPDTLEPTDGEGELVLTNIASKVFPIIRYRTGDIVTLQDGRCECGRSLRSIEVSGGRIVDFFVTKGGKWIAGYSFIYICRSIEGVTRFQVRQDRIGEIRVLLETDENFPADGVERVREATRARLKSDDEVRVEIVPEIKTAASGKYMPIVSEVARQLRAQGQTRAPSEA